MSIGYKVFRTCDINFIGSGSALFGSLIVSLTNLVLSRLLKPLPKPPAPPAKPDEVIDI